VLKPLKTNTFKGFLVFESSFPDSALVLIFGKNWVCCSCDSDMQVSGITSLGLPDTKVDRRAAEAKKNQIELDICLWQF
jgi:hypothetical protein